MKVILNDHQQVVDFRSALRELLVDAAGLDIAVSYVQVSGWDFLKPCIRGLEPQNVRLVCTDQLSITHPQALKRARVHGIRARVYRGSAVYHPKVYLAYDERGRPIRFLLGSANLSYSAFSSSIEAGVLGADNATLITLKAWFEDLFGNKSERLSAKLLAGIERNWKKTASRRVKTRLATRRRLPRQPSRRPVDVTVEDVEAIEDVFSTIRLPIALLNIDHARNNVRGLDHLLLTLRAFPDVSSKQMSELRLLGLVGPQRQLSDVGRLAKRCRSEKALAEVWCRWVKRESSSALASVNPVIASFKRAAGQFWRLRPEVRRFFLSKVNDKELRPVLQIIELLCNAGDLVREFSVEDFMTLVPLLAQVDKLPPFVREAIEDYKANKGRRTWASLDRRTVPLAWRRVS